MQTLLLYSSIDEEFRHSFVKNHKFILPHLKNLL